LPRAADIALRNRDLARAGNNNDAVQRYAEVIQAITHYLTEGVLGKTIKQAFRQLTKEGKAGKLLEPDILNQLIRYLAQPGASSSSSNVNR
jgi:hypothetical protein